MGQTETIERPPEATAPAEAPVDTPDRIDEIDEIDERAEDEKAPVEPGWIETHVVAPLVALPGRVWRETRRGVAEDWRDLRDSLADPRPPRLTLDPTRWRTLARPAAWPAAILARPALLRGGALTLAYTVATVIMTWPYAAHLSNSTFVGVDPLLQIWLFRWVQHALLTDPANLFHANANYPFELTLAWTDANVPLALLGAPIYWLSGNAILTNNLLLLGTFLLAALGMYALVVHLTHNRAAAFLAGIAYAFLPYRYIHLWHLNHLEHAWTPLILLGFLRLVARPTLGRALVLAVLIAIQALASFYLAVQIALLLGVAYLILVFVDPRLRTWRFFSRLIVGALVAALLTIPLYLPFLLVRDRLGFERDISEAEFYKGQVGDYRMVPPWADPFWPGTIPGEDMNADSDDVVGVDGHQHREFGVEDALFPGGVALVGALVALGFVWLDRRRWPIVVVLLLSGGVAFILSLGPSLGPPGSGGATLPYTWLFEHVGVFKAMRVPARWGALVAFGVVVLAGLGTAWAWEKIAPRLASGWRGERGTARLPRPGRRAVATTLTGALTLLLGAELYAAPLTLESIDHSARIAAPYEWLAAQDDGGAVMEFPIYLPQGHPNETNARRHAALQVYWSTVHWHRVFAGVSGFVPNSYLEIIWYSTRNLRRADGSLSSDVSFVGTHNIALIEQLGIRYLVFHQDQYLPEDWPAVLAAVEATGGVEKVGDFGEAVIYRVLDPHGERNLSLTFYVDPTTAAGEYWSPAIVYRHTVEGYGLLAMTDPTDLTVTWYDETGRVVLETTRRFVLPTVLRPEWEPVICFPEGCKAPTDEGVVPVPGPTPAQPPIQPAAPGRYTVEISLSGDISGSCRATVEIGAERSPDGTEQWRLCAGEATTSAPLYLEISR